MYAVLRHSHNSSENLVDQVPFNVLHSSYVAVSLEAMWRLKVVLVISEVLFLATPSLAMDSSDLCNKKPHCYHNQSLLCEIQEKPLSCNHMVSIFMSVWGILFDFFADLG